MRIIATKLSLNVWAIASVVISIIVEIILGYRISESAGWFAEMFSMVAFFIASLLFFSPRGHDKPLMVTTLSFVFMIIYGFVHAHFTTSMDVIYGGAYEWSETRMMILTAVVYPAIAIFTAIGVFIAAKFKLISFSSKA